MTLPTNTMSFRLLPDHELQHLIDDALIAYIRDARDARELNSARRALALLVFGYEANVKRRVRLKVPDQAVDDLAHDALVRAIASAFEGRSVGEFRSWLHTIVDRSIADYFRRAQRRPKEVALPSEHLEDDTIWGAEPVIVGEAEAIELRLIVDEVLVGLSEKHRQVIDLHVFTGLTAHEVAQQLPDMSEANVAQIASRFRAQLRARFDPQDGQDG